MVIMEMVALAEVQGVWMNVELQVADILEGQVEMVGLMADSPHLILALVEAVVPTTQELNKLILLGQIMDMVR